MQIKDKNLYFVGGIVRDEILGIPNFDVDYCYEGDAIEFAQAFNIVKTNPDFGTVRVLSEDGKEIDIASTRTEFYPKAGHLPVIKKKACSLQEDLKRRDFTINAMAKNTVTGTIVDYFGGLEDIKNKKIRVLHDKSFIEDPSRIIRGLKFAVRFGFELEEVTRRLQEEYLNNINYDMSFHRIKKELKEAFSLNKLEVYNKFIDEKIYKLLGENSQELFPLDLKTESLISRYSPTYIYMIYLGLFDLSNLELTKEERDIIEAYSLIKDVRPTNNVEIYKLFKNIPVEAVIMYAITRSKEVAVNYLENLANVKFETTGADLSSLGFKQGKIYGEIFDFLLEEKIKNPLLKKEDELSLVQLKFDNHPTK